MCSMPSSDSGDSAPQNPHATDTVVSGILHGECVIEFDDVYFGGPTVGKNRGRGTEKAKVFVALSLDGAWESSLSQNAGD